MDTALREALEDDLNAIDTSAEKTNDKCTVNKESARETDVFDSEGVARDTMEAIREEDERSSVMNNNFILPMESVDVIDSMDEENRSKKQKREKKDGRFYKFVKKHFLQRRNSSNDVQEIRIVPDGDEFKWARRSAGSAASRSSNETTSSEGDRLEVVHDMAEEYIPEV